MLNAAGLVINSLTLDGDLTISAVPGAKVTVANLNISNLGSALVALEDDQKQQVPEEILIRGPTNLNHRLITP